VFLFLLWRLKNCLLLQRIALAQNATARSKLLAPHVDTKRLTFANISTESLVDRMQESTAREKELIDEIDTARQQTSPQTPLFAAINAAKTFC